MQKRQGPPLTAWILWFCTITLLGWGCTHAGSLCCRPNGTHISAQNATPSTPKTQTLAQAKAAKARKARAAHSTGTTNMRDTIGTRANAALPPMAQARGRSTTHQEQPAQRRKVADISLVAPKAEAFAVVELFTSEGCSSCPPADRLAGELGRVARRHKHRVFPIVYHVDYWDHLGWRDRFGRREFTQLQQGYSQAFGNRNVYTPQMIVNGRWQFVGSHRSTAQRAIQMALQQKPTATIALCLAKGRHKHRLHGAFHVRGAQPGALLQMVVVEWGLISRVTSGENAGQRLRNDEVARAWKVHKLTSSIKGRFAIALPPRLQQRKSALIAFVRQPQSYHIVAASRLPLQGHQANCTR